MFDQNPGGQLPAALVGQEVVLEQSVMGRILLFAECHRPAPRASTDGMRSVLGPERRDLSVGRFGPERKPGGDAGTRHLGWSANQEGSRSGASSEGLPPGKPRIPRMPIAHALFSQPPAEIYGFAVAGGGEIQ